MSKPILCLDFDGVCHAYTSGWQGADVIPDGPVPGLFEFLEEAARHFEIQVFSSRSNHPGGKKAMQAWFNQQYRLWLGERAKGKEKPPVSFATQKPGAFVTLDDRAITFTGEWPRVEDLRKFKPWHKIK